jgi:N-acetylglucosamine-6-phosphate deacetylase
MKLAIINGIIITPNKEFFGGLLLKDGIIEELFEGVKDIDKEYEIIDAEKKYISPGFIDMHTHGAGGHDFMDGTEDAIIEASKTHMKFGTTTIVPTTLASSKEEMLKAIRLFDKVKNEFKEGPELLGLHLEGPYFSEEQAGAQDPKYIRDPEKKEYLEILNSSENIVRWSAAPERKNAHEFSKELKRRGIVASIAHSNATCDEVVEAFENGYNLMTHFYSGMSSVRRINAYRVAGCVEAGYLIDDMHVEIIADGAHLPANLLKLIYKVKGSDKICLVTDSMRAAGQNVKESIIGSLKNGQPVIVEDGVAKLPNRKAFAGSVATSDRCVREIKKLVGISMYEAIKMMTLNPAKILNIDNRKGSLEKGKEADILIFDENINIEKVFIKGKLKFEKVEL